MSEGNGTPMKQLRNGLAKCFQRPPRCKLCGSSMRVTKTMGDLQYRQCVSCGVRCKTAKPA